MYGISPTGYVAQCLAWYGKDAQHREATGGYLLAVANPTLPPAALSPTVLFAPDLDATTDPHSVGLRVEKRGFAMEGSYKLNSAGWAIGSGNGPALWDGTSLSPLPGFGEAINESNDITINDTYEPGAEVGHGAGLMDGGRTFVPFVGNEKTTGLVPGQFQKQIRNIFPFLLSNRRVPQASGVEPVLHILGYAQLLRTDGTDTWWEYSTFLLRKFSDGSTDLHELPNIQQPTINSSGIIAAVGNGGSVDGHALLLVPVSFSVTAWNPKMLSLTIDYTSSPTKGIYGFTVGSENGDMLTLSSTVKISIPNSIPLADSLAAQWDLVLLQDITNSSPGYYFKYSDQEELTITFPLPGQDTPAVGGITGERDRQSAGTSEDVDLPRLQAYKANNQEASLTLIDTPTPVAQSLFSFPNGTSIAGGGDIKEIYSDNHFTDYLFALNRVTGQRVYLKWLSWRSCYLIDFDVTQHPPDKGVNSASGILGQGDGYGASLPVETPAMHDTPDLSQ